MNSFSTRLKSLTPILEVKCDEQRPECGVRLRDSLSKSRFRANGHLGMSSTWTYLVPMSFFNPHSNPANDLASDYNPRLSFRDDTPRTVERMREAFVVGPSVFDGS